MADGLLGHGGRRERRAVRREKRGGMGFGFFSLISFSFLFQANPILFEFKWDLNSNLTIQTNKRDAPAWMHKHVEPKINFNSLHNLIRLNAN
jgi:hypothetical protein